MSGFQPESETCGCRTILAAGDVKGPIDTKGANALCLREAGKYVVEFPLSFRNTTKEKDHFRREAYRIGTAITAFQC